MRVPAHADQNRAYYVHIVSWYVRTIRPISAGQMESIIGVMVYDGSWNSNWVIDIGAFSKIREGQE
jgi:hypothetical protein